MGRCIARFRDDMARLDTTGLAYLWMVRYRRGGEHVKVRVHAPAAAGPALRDALETAARRFLDSLDETGHADASPDRSPDRSPPIDVEDEVEEAYPDRSFLWTQYRRSPISFGSQLFVEDDRFAAVFTRTMGHGSDQVLAALERRGDTSGGAGVEFRVRQSTVLKAIIAGLAGVGWTVQERARYLVYHRNWLLRFLLAKSRQGPERAAQLLARFDGNMEKMGPALGAIEQALAAQWSDSEGARDDGDSWATSLRDLARHVDGYGDAGANIDPFARTPAEVAVFKVLHGMANQLGLKPLDESFVYHLLLRIHAPDEDPGFVIEPARS